MSTNMVCLADGYVFPTSIEETGINENRIIVGPTRGGKTFSVVEPLLLHTFEGSLVVSLTKRNLFDKYAEMFRQRGYEVLDLNFANPEMSEIAYDPLKHVETERDVACLARAIAENIDYNSDAFWVESTSAALAAQFDLIRLNAQSAGKKPSFGDFSDLFKTLKIDYTGKGTSTNLDVIFEEAERWFPDNSAYQKWKTLCTASPKTAASISSTMNAAVDDLLSAELLEMMKKEKEISFEELAQRKTVLFITTSPVNKAATKLINIFYSNLFKSLFEYAESLPNKELPVPVHVVCDDFATGGKILDFSEYISIFCAKRISATLLLQSESQLAAMYSPADAVTIINNCDTYVYMGGMDDVTCHNISRRVNLPVDDIYALPLEQVIVFRRGSKPIIGRRYQTLEDPIYKSLFA